MNDDLAKQTINYRYDIDGMRGLAIILVLIYHIFPTLLPGGFIGVDLFFVISGYLISSIIFQQINNNTFSFVNFYIKRIKRIFPMLVVILTFVLLVGWIILTPSEWYTLSKTIKYTTLMRTNYILHRSIGYFNPSSSDNPLVHLWSLSIEEQFYLFFPFILFILSKKRKILFNSVLLIFIFSLSVNIMFIHTKHDHVFYFLKYRAWELLAGALLAYISTYYNSNFEYLKNTKFYLSNKLIQNFIVTFSFAIIFFFAITIKETKNFPGWLALIPVLSGSAFILCNNSWLNHNIFSNKIIIFIGTISYSLYLWHWPILSFCQIYLNNQLDIFIRIGIFIISFLLSIITTFFIEKPFRRSSNITAYYLIIVMIILFIFSWFISKSKIKTLSALTTPIITKIDFANNDWDYPNKNLKSYDPHIFPFHSFGNGKKVIAFFGDSNIEQYWPRVEKLLLNNHGLYNEYTVVFVTWGGQIPIFKAYKDDTSIDFLNKAESFINNYPMYGVVFGAQWSGYLSEQDKSIKHCHNLKKILHNLQKQGKKTYLILNIPIDDNLVPKSHIKRNLLSNWEIKMNDKKSDQVANKWLARSKIFTQQLKLIAKETNTVILDPYNTICRNNKCSIWDQNGYPIYKDGGHLTASYARESAKFIDQIFFDK